MRPGRRIAQVLVGGTAIVTTALLAVAPATGRLAAARPGQPAGRTTAGRVSGVRIFPMVRLVTPGPSGGLPGGYTPAQIRSAYFVNPLLRRGIDGKGSSIVIVDSFGSPTIRHDLRVFDRTFKLRPPSSFLIIHPAGRIPRFRQTQEMLSWADETTLDVEWAHVMAPAARIVLVEIPVSENEGTSGFPQIVKAEKYVIAHRLGGVISQSFGATEQTFPKGTLRPLRRAYIEAARPSHNITVVSASGDAGATDLRSDMSSYYTTRVTSWPASDPLVTSVGGLDLNLNGHGQRVVPDQVWNDPSPPPSAGGGGRSIIFGRPAFQNRVAAIVRRHRGVPDVSLSASCLHPVDIFASFTGQPSWDSICGTSEATPLLAGILALTDQVAGHPIGPINSLLYTLAAQHARGIVDITRGDNTVIVNQNNRNITVRGWPAVPGYDLSSGLGTINARWFVPELAAAAKRARR
ncbi:MAG TPA: S53 family peptidase [Streptosporangiaceae bacterium]|nr:S53 family peptidase [Streptosporangiaceae bacterium]